MLRLNSIPAKVFEAEGINNEKVKLNGEGGASYEISRKEIVATGRLVACEYIGSMVNSNPMSIEKYNSRITGANFTYDELARKHNEKKLVFCAAQVCKMTGEDAPKNFEEFKQKQLNFAQDKDFLKCMAAIDREVLSPIFPSVMDAVGGGLIQWETTGLGVTKEITVRSNDIFRWEDSSWGSGRSTSKNYLYSKTVTLNPKIYSANATIKWYQNVVNGDAGYYYAAIMLGLYNKAYAIMLKSLKAAVASKNYIPAGLTADTYTTQNWINITRKVAAANGVNVRDRALMAVGTASALNNVVPVDGTGGAMLGFQYGLGREWFENGYLPNVGGVDMFEVTPAIIPGTQNSTLDTLDTGNDIFILAKGLYKPMVGAYMEGTPITLTATPSGGNGEALGTADFTIDINAGAMFEIKPAFASKVGVITSVYPTPSQNA